MIKIQKRPDQPEKLGEDGTAQAALDRQEYDLEPEKYRSGEKKFDIDKTIYGHKSVKDPLMKDQYYKCCYCENRIDTSYGDVEHFRPKKGVQQAYGKEVKYPGYYWLAYDWKNLYYSCELCNRTHKKNLFPLVNDSGRARNHHDNLDQEQPLLVNPGGSDDPRNHIRFHGEVSQALTPKGRTTIETLDLNRPGLTEARRERLDILKTILKITRIPLKQFADNPQPDNVQQLIHDSLNLLKSSVKPCAIFSSMAQDLLPEDL